ncbi:class I SAM-dependent methyltransferase [Sphingomonas crocodyli]|uniref:Class I SAM-dependent methyltransferase n=1 Tax=Sphingomonas crocodyli TaxID=1979270 RepID=A0A437M8G6_9SPHN|nr:class I SAM-dependent methyltransferase [Sphingomonas crocodyli]RVT93794.1 class I SAM-dependent methyltransferase [Sphingomonas crocodyli]
MNATAHDRRIVDQFTRWAKPFADLPLHAEAEAMERTLAACALTADADVLDVACGPGILACAMAGQARHVTGIDLTPAMIQQAEARQAREGRSNLEWHVGDATALPFADGAFDRVTTRYSFHHMPDPAAALAEMVRVCRPGGLIVVIDATPAPDKQAAYDMMETLRDPSHTSALTLDQLRAIGREAGLREAVIDDYRLAARLAPLADAQDMAALNALFDGDIAGGQDRIGVGAWRDADGIGFHFPVSIVAWDR